MLIMMMVMMMVLLMKLMMVILKLMMGMMMMMKLMMMKIIMMKMITMMVNNLPASLCELLVPTVQQIQLRTFKLSSYLYTFKLSSSSNSIGCNWSNTAWINKQYRFGPSLICVLWTRFKKGLFSEMIILTTKLWDCEADCWDTFLKLLFSLLYSFQMPCSINDIILMRIMVTRYMQAGELLLNSI